MQIKNIEIGNYIIESDSITIIVLDKNNLEYPIAIWDLDNLEGTIENDDYLYENIEDWKTVINEVIGLIIDWNKILY